MCLGDGVERQRSDAADLIEEGVSRLNTCVYKNWREKFVYTKNGKKHFVFNTPPGAKWASAEAQFIPNFSLHTKFFIGGPFEAKFSIAHHFCQADDDHDDSGGRLQRGC